MMHPVPDLPWPQDLFAPHSQRQDLAGGDSLRNVACEPDPRRFPVWLGPARASREILQ